MLTCVIVLVALVMIMVRGSTAGPLDRLERFYLFAAPLPAILALVLPGPIAELMRNRGSSRAWGLWLNAAGGWLSLALLVAGAMLLARRSLRDQEWDRRVLIGLFVAALPALLIGLVALMYAIA
jgi:hypothetical protein